MKKNVTNPLLAFSKALLGFTIVGLTAAAAPAAAQTAYALTINQLGDYGLGTFQIATPGTFTPSLPITGLGADQELVGIDVRPATGQLFALGYNDNVTTNNAQLYTLAPTGALTPVGGLISLNLGRDGGTRVGFDFNPTVDRIRVTAGLTQANYRLNPVTGAVAATDGNLAYAATDANAGQVPGVGSSAYTNSYIGATGTTLFNLDDKFNRLVRQDPPNNGTLNTVGPLGEPINTNFQVSDLDIYFNPTSGQNEAYMSVSTISPTTFTATNLLFSVNLTTGAATAGRTLGANNGFSVVDIALAISRPTTLPVITGQLVYALAGTNLLTFDSAQPSLVRTAVGITGVDAAQTLVGLDVRPLNNALYALGYNSTAQTAQLYTINGTTGVATPTSGVFALALGTGGVSFDFNPTVDRIRVVGANRNNYRLNPVTGTLAATDGPVAYTTGTNTPTIGAVAYTNSFAGSTTTTLYNYDEVLNLLNTQSTANPPADGQLTTVGSSGIVANTNPANVDMDIYSTAGGTNSAYLVATTGTSANSSFYTVNLTTGAATSVGVIGNGITVRDIAVAAATGVTTGTRERTEVAGLGLYPNPLTAETRLAFTLAAPARVTLVVTDALGRQVDRIEAGRLGAGTQGIRWNSTSNLRQGVYFFQLLLDGQAAGTQRGVLLD
ncbi:DUF4394 domain-containing protein [Hymenobacter chitinivorans]|uniref:Putative secreted protein (Por secretion system target) n=1 Tax=Hymenobacter chitinivorans DSM 11115 TaxID=1121954 RepID=A0A2M9AQL6_9BACT|nr:DUF4394 domain-containing protein [Hymenobacter chitinivorans]PJJ47995.1 putative secreted protein (Por secretion system target) [Hymenobacter chitinivorans DSM 11115]